MVYNEIFQALMVEGDIMLSKPLLDLGFDRINRCKSPIFKRFLKFSKRTEIQRGKVRNVWQMGKMLPCQMSSRAVVV
jgi:hypothetical protein